MMRSGFLSLALAPLLAGLGSVALAQQPTPAPSQEIDLKLFDKAEIDRSKGCTVALWQQNRDPENDRYAIVFGEQLRGQNHLRDAARIKIGNQVIPLQRIATGGKSEGYGLYPFQLYRMPDEQGYVVLDLKLGALEGEAIDIESGKLMVSMLGKQAFRMSVKGGAGCMGAPLPAGNAAGQPAATQAAVPARAQPTPPGPAMFERHNVQPALFSPGFRKEVEKKFKCDAAFMRTGVVGFSLSEESAIWQIPCERFAYQTTAVFALVYTAAPEKEHQFIAVPGPKGHKRTNDPGILMSPQWDIKNRIVTSISLGRAAGDCGVLERYRVTPEGQFALVEYREKPQCDGAATKPEQFPLIFPKR